MFGGAAVGTATQAEADQTLDVLLQYGVNHIDTAAGYGNGEAEKRIGSWMGIHREHFFLATKTGQRTFREAKDEFQASLERLRVDSVDLIQLHNLVDPGDWDIALGPGGALEALVEAREQGLTRFIGVTGHGLTAADIHLRSLERFEFDSVLLPLNFPPVQDAQYAADFHRLCRDCRDKRVAVQTIKSIARGPWGARKRNRTTWYEPLEEQADIDKAVHWVLGHTDVFLNTAGDIGLLPKVLEAASKPSPPASDGDMEAMAHVRQMAPLFPEPSA